MAVMTDITRFLAGHPNVHIGNPNQLAALEIPTDRYIRTPSRSGALSLMVVDASTGKTHTYCSKYDPVREGRQQVETNYKNQTHCMVFGMGMGHSVNAIRQKAGDKADLKVFVIEPDPYVFLCAVSSGNLSGVISDRRFEWFIGGDENAIGEIWSSTLDWTSLEGLMVIEHPPTSARFSGFLDRLIEKLRYLCNRSQGNLVTLMKAGTTFHTNYFANMASYIEYPGVERLFNKFKGVPAVVVASGPSLEKNIDLLKRIKGKFLIISVDTALRQLVAHGIKPDLVCAADPSYENSLDFVGVENEAEVVLVVEPMTHPDILESFKGSKMIVDFGGTLTMIMQKFREPIGRLVTWGSIATTTFDLARKAGCDPIIFVGLDLSFQDGKLYARGSYSDDLFFEKINRLTSLEHETAMYIATRGRFQVSGSDGEVLFTDQNMHVYKGWFEDQFKNSSQLIINATEGGAVNRYVERMPLGQAIEKFSNNSAQIEKIISESLDQDVQVDVAGMIAALASLSKEMREVESGIRKAANLCRKLSRRAEALTINSLSGPERVSFDEVLQIRNKFLANQTLLQWFTVFKTRFATRHTMEIKKLQSEKESSLAAWMDELTAFFHAVGEFCDYQIPLLEEALRVANRSETTRTKFFQKA